MMDKARMAELFAELFDEKPNALGVLAKIDVEPQRLRSFDSMPADQWWANVISELDKGLVENGLERLRKAAADVYPGQSELDAYREESSDPERRGGSSNIEITLPEDLSDDDVLALLQTAIGAIRSKGRRVVVNVGTTGSYRFQFSVEDASQEELEEYRRDVEQQAHQLSQSAEVRAETDGFRDYMLDPLVVEGPDGRRFNIDRLEASSTVGDLANGIMGEYADKTWPMRQGRRQGATVDLVRQGGKRDRLDPSQTLHDAGVRPGDQLEVNPERSAGAVAPLMRQEALARVRGEVLDYAEAHAGFGVEANSTVAPTEYLFKFTEQSYARTEAGNIRAIDSHEVLVVLPPDFPIKAPEAWWQNPIFHPNIHPKNGLVCLGALQEHYRPGLDFGELCQMLVDMAGLRAYTVEDPFNVEAAKWAVTEEGQIAIEKAGGYSLFRQYLVDAAPKRKMRVRRIN